jgi:serine/threonine protein kinase
MLSIRTCEASSVIDVLHNVCMHINPPLSTIHVYFQVLAVVSSGKHHDGAIRKAASNLLMKVMQEFNILPSTLFLTGVVLYSRDPVNAGGYADILRGSYHGEEVALKRFRIYAHSHERMILHKVCSPFLQPSFHPWLKSTYLQRLCREILLWQSLDHPHVLPFIGVDSSSFDSMICMVSPWMHHGSLLDYRTQRNITSTEINALVRDEHG